MENYNTRVGGHLCLTEYNVTMGIITVSTLIAAIYHTSIVLATSRTNLNTEAITLMDEIKVHGIIREGNGTHFASHTSKNGCGSPIVKWHDSNLGVKLAMPEWEALLTTVVLSVIIVLTIIGNILVILSVFTYKPLRIVQNFFIVSLAVADLTVALLVLPFNVGYYILGRWEFGIMLCKLWLTCDVMCCTSSILNLCAIALDRYWAITDPINYAQKRTVQRVLLLITGVWVLSLLISSPPLLGWNDWPNEFTNASRCELNSDHGYVVYSSLGSFFIPLITMACVYIEIFIATRRRLRERSLSNKINTTAKPLGRVGMKESGPTIHNDQGSSSSENNIKNEPARTHTVQDDVHVVQAQRKKTHRLNIKDSNMQGTSIAAINGNRDRSLNMQHLRNVNLQRCISKTNENIDIDNDITLLKRTPHQSSKTACVSQFIEEKQKISLSKERRAARTLGIIMGAFVICWLPFFLMYVILPFCATCCLTTKLKNFITWLGYINSVLNPIIYTVFNLDYRRAFTRLLGLN